MMEPLGGHRFKSKGKEYELALVFDDEALMEASAKFSITGRSRDEGGGDWEEITLEIDVQLAAQQIVVSHEGAEIGTIPLDLPIDDDDNLDADWGEIFKPFKANEPIEAVLDAIPVDPILGCLVKGSLSSTVGQTIRCWREHREIGPNLEFARKIRRRKPIFLSSTLNTSIKL